MFNFPIVPVWPIPLLALLMVIYRLHRFWQSQYKDYLQLGYGVIDLYFVIIFTWVAADPSIVLVERAEAVRGGILLLFCTNVLYMGIKLYKEYLDRKLQKKKKNKFNNKAS